MEKANRFETVDQYISTFPETTQHLLQELRNCIRKTAPEAEELISYNMPAFKYKGMLVYYAAYKNHIGFYPASAGIATFKDKLKGFKTSKGAVQFPLAETIPLNLIKEMVLFRVEENIAKELLTLKKKRAGKR